MSYPRILTETCVCGAKTEVLIASAYATDVVRGHEALAVWRLEHRHEKPNPTVRIPLARRRA